VNPRHLDRLQLVTLAVALLLGVAVIVLVIKWAPEWLASTGGLKPSDRLAEVGRVRTALLACLAGGIAIIGAVYTARTFALNRHGQITDRFTRAIDQLGSPQIDVRLGGIYALARIAQESPADHWPIMEILTAYVREHSKVDPASTQPDSAPGTDVQAILSVISQRRVEHDGPRRLDLSRVRLGQAVLGGAKLAGANFSETDLSGAQVVNGDFRGADFTSADLSGAQVFVSDFSGAVFTSADLSKAMMGNVDFSQAELIDTNLERASLHRANMPWVHAIGANLRGAVLMGATLRWAHLDGANLEDASLDGAQLDEASYTAATVWPSGFDPEERGARRMDPDLST
jgi:hypothetical protein